MEQGLSNPQALPSSHMHDSVLCTEVADVNWDGENELVLGTYGKVSELPCPYIAHWLSRVMGCFILYTVGSEYNLSRFTFATFVLFYDFAPSPLQEILVYQVKRKGVTMIYLFSLS